MSGHGMTEGGKPLATATLTGPEALVNILERHRWPLAQGEAAVQAEMARRFALLGLAFERETVLGPRERIDFTFPSGRDDLLIGLEVKMNRARPADVARQLRRYALCPRIEVLVLATNRAQELPGYLNGPGHRPTVPLWQASLGRAWL